jgi:hypothetical protein
MKTKHGLYSRDVQYGGVCLNEWGKSVRTWKTHSVEILMGVVPTAGGVLWKRDYSIRIYSKRRNNVAEVKDKKGRDKWYRTSIRESSRRNEERDEYCDMEN